MSGPANPTPVPVTVVVGVTGHREIDPAAAGAVRCAVHEVLASLQKQFPHALHVMTALAAGADQLVADVAEELGIPIVAVLPMGKDFYLTEMPAVYQARFDHHWDRAALRLELPSVVAHDGKPDTNWERHQYEQLGAFLARRSHLLLVLWEGAERADPVGGIEKLGGTADVLRMRFDVQRANEVCHRSALFERSGSPLDAPQGDPVLHVVTPRKPHAEQTPRFSGSDPRPGACFLLRSWSGLDRDAVDPPSSIMQVMELPPYAVTKGLFDQIRTLNELLLGKIAKDSSIFKDQLNYLDTKGAEDTDHNPLDWLRRAQAGIDAASVRYQRFLLGYFVAKKLHSIPRAALYSWLCSGVRVKPGLLLVYTGAVPVAVLLFEWYAHMSGEGETAVSGVAWSLAAYLVWLGVVFGAHHFIVKKLNWQNYFQDYRALAEAIRVQLYWALAAAPIAASDNYLRKQIGELGWISFALRGPALWATALALKLPKPYREVVRRGWMENQADYFVGKDRKSGKAAENHHALRRNRFLAIGFFVLGLGVAAVLLVSKCPWLTFGSICVADAFRAIQCAKNPLIVAAATLPAIAAFLTVSTNIRAYEAHAHNYKQMGQIFGRALDVAGSIGDGEDSKFKDLVRDLGREALAENAEWLMDHRDRQVEAGP